MVTMREVAALAGVSVTTVSHVINDTRPVSEPARQRVQEAMDQLNYRPNRLARSLRRGQTHALGLVLPDITDDFFAETARYIEDAAFEQGFSVFLCNADRSVEKELFYARLLLEKQVDGLVFVSIGLQAEHMRLIRRSGTPVVIVDRDIHGADCDAVLVDNVAGGRMATEHLLALGHRRIGCLTGNPDIAPFAQRLQGYQDALAAVGLPVEEALITKGDFARDRGAAATSHLLALPDPPTGIVASNDLIALGAIHRARTLGFPVPQRLSVVGFDDVRMASLSRPTITTVAQPTRHMGRRAVEMLLQRIVEPGLAPRRELMPVRLMVRESTAPSSEETVISDPNKFVSEDMS